MSHVLGRVVLTVGALVYLAAGASAQQQTTSATETKTFEVIAVDGNQLDVRLPEGTREITVPEDFRFNIDGKEMSVHELTPGMKGTATITTNTTVTPVTVTQVKNGTVMQVSGGTIVVRTDEGIKAFSQSDIDKRGIKIVRDGKPASISDFHTGDRLSATIVTAQPPRVMTQREVQATLAKPTQPAAAAAPTPSASAAPGEPRSQGTTGSAAAAEPPQTLPKTASFLPLSLLVGVASLLLAAALTVARRRLMR